MTRFRFFLPHEIHTGHGATTPYIMPSQGLRSAFKGCFIDIGQPTPPVLRHAYSVFSEHMGAVAPMSRRSQTFTSDHHPSSRRRSFATRLPASPPTEYRVIRTHPFDDDSSTGSDNRDSADYPPSYMLAAAAHNSSWPSADLTIRPRYAKRPQLVNWSQALASFILRRRLSRRNLDSTTPSITCLHTDGFVESAVPSNEAPAE